MQEDLLPFCNQILWRQSGDPFSLVNEPYKSKGILYESKLAGDHACLRQCTWSHRHRCAADSWGLRMYSHLNSRELCPVGLKIECSKPPSNTAEMHITQAVSLPLGIRLRISVYHKWTLRLKIIILYSQKCHRTKFLSSKKWRNWPLFWPWCDIIHRRFPASLSSKHHKKAQDVLAILSTVVRKTNGKTTFSAFMFMALNIPCSFISFLAW